MKVTYDVLQTETQDIPNETSDALVFFFFFSIIC